MLIMGLDPSLAAVGWAVIQDKEYVESGVYNPSPAPLDGKLAATHTWLCNKLHGSLIGIVAIEMPYVGQNANTHYKLSALSGVLRVAVQGHGLRIIPIYPAARCRPIGLKGNASKLEILERVNEIYDLDISNFDESDAIALALAGRHIHELPRV